MKKRSVASCLSLGACSNSDVVQSSGVVSVGGRSAVFKYINKVGVVLW